MRLNVCFTLYNGFGAGIVTGLRRKNGFTFKVGEGMDGWSGCVWPAAHSQSASCDNITMKFARERTLQPGWTIVFLEYILWLPGFR